MPTDAISTFRDSLTALLRDAPLPKDVTSEKDFETRLLIPAAASAAANIPGLFLYVHPWSNLIRCKPNCEEAEAGNGDRRLGCPRCWARSKEWAAVSAFGSRHTFDLVARHTGGGKLAVEAKLLAVKKGRMPNGELQRLLGQCLLAASKHTAVIGFVGYRPAPGDPDWPQDNQMWTRWQERCGISLVLRRLA